jgi:hypothetical protein
VSPVASSSPRSKRVGARTSIQHLVTQGLDGCLADTVERVLSAVRCCRAMSKPKATARAIAAADVDVDRSWLRLGGRDGKATKTSRAAGLQTGHLRLVHRPTKITVVGEVPEGHYSRKEMATAMQMLHDELLHELERLVERHFRRPGRTSP